MRKLVNDIPGAAACSGFNDDLEIANPYLPLRLLLDDEPFGSFCHVYAWVAQEIRKGQ
jgi:hypothetical protein